MLHGREVQGFLPSTCLMASEPQIPGARLCGVCFLPFCHTWPNTIGRFTICHCTQARQHCFDGVFKAPLSALAHNYFYKALLSFPGLRLLHRPLHIAFCSMAAETLTWKRAPAVSAITVSHPAHAYPGKLVSLLYCPVGDKDGLWSGPSMQGPFSEQAFSSTTATQTYWQHSIWNRNRILPQTPSRASFPSLFWGVWSLSVHCLHQMSFIAHSGVRGDFKSFKCIPSMFWMQT